MAEQLEMSYVAAAAAQGGRKGLAAVRSMARKLRKAAGLRSRIDPERLAASLGLSMRSSRP